MKYFYTWQEFDEDIAKIAEWARDKNFRSVYGIPRGGLVVSVALSHRLNLPLKLKREEIDEKTLIADDISDSGKTLQKLEASLPFKPVIATIFYHKDTTRMPNLFLREKTAWVVFPWETDVSSKYDATFN